MSPSKVPGQHFSYLTQRVEWMNLISPAGVSNARDAAVTDQANLLRRISAIRCQTAHSNNKQWLWDRWSIVLIVVVGVLFDSLGWKRRVIFISRCDWFPAIIGWKNWLFA